MKSCCWSLDHSSVQKNTHEETSFCVKNVSKLSVWMRFGKSIFSFSMRAFPEDNESHCLHKHRKFVLGLACSAVRHMVSQHFDGGDSTMINVFLSIFPSLFLRLCLYCQISINKRKLIASFFLSSTFYLFYLYGFKVYNLL